MMDYPQLPFTETIQLDDICENRHKGNRESWAANIEISLSKQALRDQILRRIAAVATGMTCDEVEIALEMKHQTCSARISELKRDGLLVPTGERRYTRSGRTMAAVYRVRSNP